MKMIAVFAFIQSVKSKQNCEASMTLSQNETTCLIHSRLTKVCVAIFIAALSTGLFGCSPMPADNTAIDSSSLSTGIGASSVLISPAQAQVQVSGQQTLNGTNGTAPYSFYIVAGGGSITQQSTTSAVYTAPASNSSVQVQVRDANGNTATSYLSVNGASASAIVVSPLNPSVTAGGQVTFNVSGGTAPYTYNVVSNGGGSFSGNVFTAAAFVQTAVVQFTDSIGTTTTTTITVNAAEVAQLQIYRLYNAGFTDHLYSTSNSEGTDNSYTLDGPAFKVLKGVSPGGSYALNRCHMTKTGRHFLSTGSACDGQTFEGFVGYVSLSQDPGMVPLYRFTSTATGDTIESVTAGDGARANYVYYGVMGYVYP
jgi:hypothetical protein